MIRLLIVCLILGVLGGCSVMDGVRKNFYMTDEEKLAEKEARYAGHRKKCTELGFNPQNVEHTNCVLELEKATLQAEAAYRAVRKTASSIEQNRVNQQILNHGAGGCTPNFSTGGCL